MNNTLIVSFFVVVAVGVVVLTIINAIHRRQMSFEGVVVDKNMNEIIQQNTTNQPASGFSIGGNNNATVTHNYSIRVKTDAGKVISYGISSGMYETIKIGDHVSKAHGTTDITIVDSAPAA